MKNLCIDITSLDGKEFDFYEEVPERPHPNCRCTVEIVEDTSSNNVSETATKENDDANKMPPQNPIPQPASKPPQPNPAPKNSSQSQRWILPVSKGYKITSNYGYRIHPVYRTRKFHAGIDINVIANTPVYAVADGKVSIAGWINGYGNYIQIEHSNGLSSFYAHLNQINVVKGQTVKQGQIIGKSGNTGVGTGAHLHFGVKKNEGSDNPMKYLPSF